MLKDLVVSCIILWVTYELTSSTYRAASSTKRGALLKYSRIASLLGCGFVSFAFIIGLSIVMSPGMPAVGIRNASIAFALMIVPGLWLVTGAARGQVLITCQEIIHIKKRGSRVRIRWRDVVIVNRNLFSLGYDVRAIDGRRITVSDLLVGQKQFAETVLDKVSATQVRCESTLRKKRRL